MVAPMLELTITTRGASREKDLVRIDQMTATMAMVMVMAIVAVDAP